jgi:hypothetical protein
MFMFLAGNIIGFASFIEFQQSIYTSKQLSDACLWIFSIHHISRFTNTVQKNTNSVSDDIIKEPHCCCQNEQKSVHDLESREEIW